MYVSLRMPELLAYMHNCGRALERHCRYRHSWHCRTANLSLYFGLHLPNPRHAAELAGFTLYYQPRTYPALNRVRMVLSISVPDGNTTNTVCALFPCAPPAAPPISTVFVYHRTQGIKQGLRAIETARVLKAEGIPLLTKTARTEEPPTAAPLAWTADMGESGAGGEDEPVLSLHEQGNQAFAAGKTVTAGLKWVQNYKNMDTRHMVDEDKLGDMKQFLSGGAAAGASGQGESGPGRQTGR